MNTNLRIKGIYNIATAFNTSPVVRFNPAMYSPCLKKCGGTCEGFRNPVTFSRQLMGPSQSQTDLTGIHVTASLLLNFKTSGRDWARGRESEGGEFFSHVLPQRACVRDPPALQRNTRLQSSHRRGLLSGDDMARPNIKGAARRPLM